MANTQFLAVDKLDFFSLKSNLKEFLKGQTAFKDYNFDGPNLSVLLDLLAYNTYQNAFLLNMVGNESFLDSSIIRDSAASHAKALNYLPRSYTSAGASIRVGLNVTNSQVSSVTIPAGTKFSGSKDGLSFIFTTEDPTVVRRDSNNHFIANNVLIYEGFPVTEYFIANGSVSDQRFILSNSRVDTDSIDINVQASQVDTTNADYTYASSLYGLNANSTVYFIQPAEGDRYELIFGDGTFGKALTNGNVVKAAYRVASGNNVNGISSFTAVSAIGGYSANVTTLSASAGGAAMETIQSIKFRAPRHFQSQERAITSSDFKALLINEFAELKDVGVYGGEEVLSSPQYGKVFVAPSTTTGLPLSTIRKTEIEAFLRDRMTLGMMPVIIDPDYLYLSAVVEVTYDPNLTQKSTAQIEDEVQEAITSYNDDNLGIFGATFRYSKFINAIDDCDDAIVSNETTVNMFKIIVPPLNTVTSYSLDFGNELEGSGCVSSTAFTYDSKTAYIGDANGVLYVYEDTSAGQNVLLAAAGTVDYTTGILSISNFSVNDYDGDGIHVNAVPLHKDVKGVMHSLVLFDISQVQIDVNNES